MLWVESINCTIFNNSGILIELGNHTVVAMEACDIFDNVFEFLSAMIGLENRCHLNILATNISGNKLFRISSIMRSTGRSSVFSKNCNYFNNSASNFLYAEEGDTSYYWM